MGGSIAVAVRRSDGREVVYDRWTNPLPYYTVDPLFRKEDEATLQVFHDRVVESMKNDWGSTIINEIYPISYGIIAIDFQTKDILSLQGYCYPCRAHFCYSRGQGMTSDPEDDMKLMLRLLKDGAKPLNFEKFNQEGFDDDYVNKLVPAIEDALANGNSDLPHWVKSMTFKCPEPFTVQHGEIYDYDWNKDGREWFESRGWKTPVLDLPPEFIDDDDWDEDEEE